MAPILILGGGPTGLFIGSLLKDQGKDVTIFEKRIENTRKRQVKLLGRIANTDLAKDTHFFSEEQMQDRKNAIQSMKCELFCKIVSWLEVATPINTIQNELKHYFEASGGVMQIGEEFDNSQMQNYPNTLVIDCTGYHSVLRDEIQPDNSTVELIEHVIVWTFLLNGHYECDELCKYFKNIHTQKYLIIPSVNGSYVVEPMKTHVTCLITINETIFGQVSEVKPLTYAYLDEHFPEICDDMDLFLINLSNGLNDKLPIDPMEFIAIPLHIYKAKKTTHITVDNHLQQQWILMGDAAMGGPYFQSISIGFEAAIYFAYLFQRMNADHGDVKQKVLKKYEDYMEKLWLTMQFRSKEIQRNKELFKALFFDDLTAILYHLKVD